jgi:hypothetical protein
MARLRPRAARNAQSVESALGEYLRNALDEGVTEESTRAIAVSVTAGAEEGTAEQFRSFLQVVQADLIEAIRDFETPVVVEDSTEGRIGEAEIREAISRTSVEESGTQGESPEQREGEPHPSIDSTPIPTFHAQPGQTIPGQRANVSTTDGVRRLNFFRAHLFPAVRQTAEDIPIEQDPNAMVPAIFVGVRSLVHEPRMTTDQLAAHPSFPFEDGRVPEGEDSPSESAEPPQSPGARRQSLRSRILNRFSAPTTPAHVPLTTYLVYVIGGNYPRSHPVLSIPNLVTGGPLTDEELQLVSELMGPGKPPTATQDDIDNAGLQVVKGAQMVELAKEGKVLDSCVERCLVSLASPARCGVERGLTDRSAWAITRTTRRVGS